ISVREESLLYRIYSSLPLMEPMEPMKPVEGLIPAVAQDWKTGEVLMLAYMNNEALQKTRETGIAHYWSRSRNKLWLKGESSGHVQRIKEIRMDCDEDAILLLVEQEGGACHTGYRSCFYRTIDGKIVGEKVFEPDDVY
ncbi:MAG: phosphoribosyl-AMP cyclohydrolase, partial [Methanotrichaceae archaeon]|nr:phosphoribosyl-AMP cyclohydrolase [Methanotrichaceae archaeon]